MKVLMIICIAVAVLLLVFTLIPKFKTPVNNNSTFFNLAFTLLATFIGVFVAMAVTNINDNRKEEEKCARLLKAALYEIQMVQSDFEVHDMFFKKDTAIKILLELRSKNASKLPTQFLNIMQNETVLNHLTTTGTKHLNYSISNINRNYEMLEHFPFQDAGLFFIAFSEYKRSLTFASDLLHCEIDYLQHKFDIDATERQEKWFVEHQIIRGSDTTMKTEIEARNKAYNSELGRHKKTVDSLEAIHTKE